MYRDAYRDGNYGATFNYNYMATRNQFGQLTNLKQLKRICFQLFNIVLQEHLKCERTPKSPHRVYWMTTQCNKVGVVSSDTQGELTSKFSMFFLH